MKLTIFTPTYNRAYILENLYRSLQRQTCHDFEWLIVDDGSLDDTETLVHSWMKEENPFPVRYYKQENGGKHTAINRGLEFAQGELFFTVDSDDYLTPDALEKIIAWEAGLPKDGSYCGLAGNLGTAPDVTPNRIFPEPYVDGTALDRYREIDGERAMVFYTEVHRRYLYPTFPGEKFMTEAVTWNRMARDGYKIRFFNDIIWIYEYKADGLTKAGISLFLNNPMGYGLWLREKNAMEHKTLCGRIKLYYSFTCDLQASLSTKEIAKCIDAPYALIAFIKGISKLKHLRK